MWSASGDFYSDGGGSARAIARSADAEGVSPSKKKTGRPGKLSVEDQVLMTLEYWREYRTYFHIGQSWGVNESTAYRIIRKIEDILMTALIKKCNHFSIIK